MFRLSLDSLVPAVQINIVFQVCPKSKLSEQSDSDSSSSKKLGKKFYQKQLRKDQNINILIMTSQARIKSILKTNKKYRNKS